MTLNEPHSIALYAFEKRQGDGAREIALSAFDGPPSDDAAFRWAHLDLAKDGVASWIAEISDEFVAAALTVDDTRPRCAVHDEGVLLNLRGVNLNPASDPEDMVSIRVWACAKLIISVRIRRLAAVAEVREALEAGRGVNSVGAFLAALAAGLTANMAPVVSELAEAVDGLEEQSIETIDTLREDLADTRRVTIMLRRYIAPQREALLRLIADGGPLLADGDRISLRETVDQVTRVVEELDAIRERGAVLHDQLTDRRAEEMNRNMLVLSVVAAVFLPLGFLTGLLGVNVGGIPGADNAFAFSIVCILMAVIAGALIALFKKMKWL